MDALSEVLRMIRLQGALFLHALFHEPWCVGVPPGRHAAYVLCPGARQLAILHMVLDGRCWIQAEGGEPIELAAGDVVLLPAGPGHLIGCGREGAPAREEDALEVKLPDLERLRYGGDGPCCSLVCGWFANERDVANPLLAALPAVLRVPLGRRPAGAWVEQSLRYALQQAAQREPGATAVMAKVAETMLIETLRAYLEDLPPHQDGWLAGLRDPQVGRCLALMHANPAHAWSLEQLAREVHSSRSVLAERFTGLLGTPPMKYLKRWRLALAARMLCDGGSNIVRVAEAVGYESEAAFSRAFKTEYGVPPGAWRHGGNGVAAGAQGTGRQPAARAQ